MNSFATPQTYVALVSSLSRSPSPVVWPAALVGGFALSICPVAAGLPRAGGRKANPWWTRTLFKELFTKHCLDCHAAQEPEAKLVLDSFENLMHGGESGPAILPLRSGESLLIKMVEGNVERAGKSKIMPPGKRAKLSATEIGALKAWIDAGAQPSSNPTSVPVFLSVPKILPKGAVRRPVHALAYNAPGTKSTWLLGPRRGIEILSAQTQSRVRALTGQQGAVNALVFSGDGQLPFPSRWASKINGEIKQWNVTNGSLAADLHRAQGRDLQPGAESR